MGSILRRLLCSNRLNIQPKLQGACPDFAQLCGADDIKKYIHESGITKASLVSLCRNLFDPLFLAPPFIATAINQSIYSLQQSYLIFQEMKAYNRATVSTISLHKVYVHKNNYSVKLVKPSLPGSHQSLPSTTAKWRTLPRTF